VRASASARVLIIGQAPGTRVHETGIPWNDRSGDRLRTWLDIDSDAFYDERRIAIVPMGFCYPGVDKNGGDNPPRPACAPLWHPSLMALMPNLRLTLLVGMYAQNCYLAGIRRKTMTETVANHADYLPRYFPLPHPSWRTTGWQKRNPWFEASVLPSLRAAFVHALAD
jgi:uracil-DNA glycosylase